MVHLRTLHGTLLENHYYRLTWVDITRRNQFQPAFIRILFLGPKPAQITFLSSVSNASNFNISIQVSDEGVEFPHLGFMIGQLCLRLYEPDMGIGNRAMEGIYVLYFLMRRQQGKRSLKIVANRIIALIRQHHLINNFMFCSCQGSGQNGHST